MKFAVSFFAFLAVLALSGCGNNVQFGLTGTGQNFQQSASSFTNQLDILWVVDNSSSMGPLQANMTANFSSFISGFQSKGYDFRMAVTSTDAYKANPSFTSYTSGNNSLSLFQDGGNISGTPASGVFVITPQTPNLSATFLNNATTGIVGSGDERAFSSLVTAMQNKNNPAFLRPSSFFAVIFLSDEDDFSLYSRTEGSWGSNDALDHCYVDPTMDGVATTAYSGSTHVATCAGQTPPDSVASYEAALDAITQSTGATRRWNASTIAVLDSTCQLSHSESDSASFVSIVGQRMIQMSNDTQGVQGSICDTSYANSLQAIAQQIEVLSTQFYLNIIPNPATITVAVNGVPIAGNPTNGWTYNSSANSIQFHGTATPPQGATISVNFTPVEANH